MNLIVQLELELAVVEGKTLILNQLYSASQIDFLSHPAHVGGVSLNTFSETLIGL